MTIIAHEAFRILVADDEQQMRDAYEAVLRQGAEFAAAEDELHRLEAELFGAPAANARLMESYELTLCRQGDEAVEAVRQARQAGRPFAVAFLDVRMPPGMNGVEAAKAIREADPDVHIVIVTGYSDVHPREIARRITPAEKLCFVVKPFQPQELLQLAATLTHKWKVEADLHRAHARLKEQLAHLELAYEETLAAKRQAELASQAKTVFLANMSHELRTPFNAIMGFTELMVREQLGPLGNPRYREYAQDVHVSAKHLLHLIDDILDVARVESQGIEVHPEAVRVGDILSESLSIMRAQASAANIALALHVDPNLPLVRVDAKRVRQALLNLISNALKFSPHGSTVRVQGLALPTGFEIKVSDEGIGIAPSDLERVLLPFAQVEHAMNREYSGAGLGLTLAKAIVERHGGELLLESQLGTGTTVSLRFPSSGLQRQEAA